MILNTNWDPLKALKRCSTIPGMAATWDVQETSSWAGTRREQNWVGTCPIDLEWCVYIYVCMYRHTHGRLLTQWHDGYKTHCGNSACGTRSGVLLFCSRRFSSRRRSGERLGGKQDVMHERFTMAQQTIWELPTCYNLLYILIYVTVIPS
jgi:hypothetical protein